MSIDPLKENIKKGNYDDLMSKIGQDFYTNDLNKLVERKKPSNAS